jgi:hypothetical protein
VVEVTALTLTDAEELVLASALRLEHGNRSKLRADAERQLASGDRGIDWAYAACAYEKRLATLDGLIGKLPTWVARAVAS